MRHSGARTPHRARGDDVTDSWDDTPMQETMGAPRYFSRELSLLDFHRRVLEQTAPGAHPLLERAKFLAISDSNLDEFLSIHFSLLLGRIEMGERFVSAGGHNPSEYLRRVRDALRSFMRDQRTVLNQQLEPEMAAQGIHFRDTARLSPGQQRLLRQWFLREVFPICTPLAVDPAHPFPFISNLSLNLGVVLNDHGTGESFARIKVPAALRRLVPVPEAEETTFVWLEDVMAANVDLFFPGVEVRHVSRFRVIRHADLELQAQEALDLRELVEAGVRERRFGEAVCVQLEADMPTSLRQVLVERLDVYPEDVYVVGGRLGLTGLFQLGDLSLPDLLDPPLRPRIYAPLAGSDIFAAIRSRDFLLYHPYDSFAAVENFVAQAAKDPDVLAIKQTLYRTGNRSTLVDRLLDAVDLGKQVAVALELQARGDEQTNLTWAQRLERGGAHVSYGVIGLKTHAKVCLVVRRESDGLRRYMHIGTGNYSGNPYADLSLFTSNPLIGEDATELFNALTGRSYQEQYNHLLVAPLTLRRGILDRINREIERHEQHGDGRLIFKTNALTDHDMIETLYRASDAGLSIDLLVRGMCQLRPGVPGMSENIRVTSLVGRYLEHARVYYFANGGKPEVLIGSADLMERNLDRRIEILCPILDQDLAAKVYERLLLAHLRDTVRTTTLQPSGAYLPIAASDSPPFDVQLAWVNNELSFMR